MPLPIKSQWRPRLLTSLVVLITATTGHGVSLKPKSHYLVQTLGDVVPAYEEFDGHMYAGMIPIHSSKDARRQGELMFWLFAPAQPSVPDSLVMWLNGGPGCSSFQCGNLFETGPVTVPLHPAGWCCGKVDEPLLVNEHAWTTRTYMLYIEQPVGVGFSWGPEPETEDDVAEDMLGWLHNFFTIFEELKPYDFYIFGESYAGMYAPAIAHGIHHEKSEEKINLKGIALGNGWIDVTIQGPAVIDYAWWHGMIDRKQRDAFLDEWQTCLATSPLNQNADSVSIVAEPYHVFTTPDECGIAGAILQAAGKGLWPTKFEPNTYEVTTWDTYPVIMGANTSTFQLFYNNPKVQKALHAPLQKWDGCVEGAGRRRRLKHVGRSRRLKVMLDNDRPLSMLGYLAELLDEAKIRVLVYNADLDMSVNAQGSENALNAMKWSGAHQWAKQKRGVWTTPTQIDKVAGYAKEVDGLTFVVVRNSGHMVPYNQPENGLDLLTRFLQKKSFVDEVVPFFPADPVPKLAPQQPATGTASRGLLQDSLTYITLLAIGYALGFAIRRRTNRGGYEPINGHPKDGF